MASSAPDAWTGRAVTFSRTESPPETVSVSGKRDFEARDNSAKTTECPSFAAAETGTPTAEPANSGLFGSYQEISASARVRGGPERTRTACQARSYIEPVSETSQTARLLGTRTSLQLDTRKPPGNGILRAETKRRKPASRRQGQDQRLISNGQSPPFRHYSPVSRKLLERWD